MFSEFDLVLKFFVLFSNFTILLPILITFYERMYLHTFIFILLITASSIYHGCQINSPLTCSSEQLNRVETIDQFVAGLSIIIVAIEILYFFIRFSIGIEILIVVLFGIVVGIVLWTGMDHLFNSLNFIPIVVSLILFIIIIVVLSVRNTKKFYNIQSTKQTFIIIFKGVQIPLYISGILILILSVIFSALPNIVGPE